jgi:hypothetical protein
LSSPTEEFGLKVRVKRTIVGLLLLCAAQLLGSPHTISCPTKLDHCLDSSPLQQPVSIRIFKDFLVVMEGQIGDDLKLQNFVLDTGTTPSIINERIVRGLGLPTASAALVAVGKVVETQSAIIPQMQLGPIRAVSLPVQVKNLSQLEHDFGIPIAGIVGMDVLAKANFHLDYRKRQIEFGEALREGIPIPFDARAGIAVAEVKLAGKRVRMLVDTGSDQVLVLGGNFGDPQQLGLHLTSDHGASVAESKMSVQEFPARDIQLAGQHFSREKAYFLAGPENPGFDGLLGVRALGFRGISFDQARSTLYLQK